MNYITTTQLRTKSSKLVQTLKEGGTVKLVHRSHIIGEIKPQKEIKIMTREAINKLKKLAKQLNLPKLSYRQREKIYRKHLEEKYGKVFLDANYFRG